MTLQFYTTKPMDKFSTVNEILDFAIEQEQSAVDFYTSLSENAANHEMKSVFAQFAREEMDHKAKLMQVKETGILEAHAGTVQDLKIADFVVRSEATPEMSYEQALVLAMKREKAAFKLYSRLAERSGSEELRQLFLSLAIEESKHKLRFEIEYDEYVLREN
ncbi:MAG: ferritin family protein [Bacteroidales bacterium]|nr:ferritin family protein [Bacteroidales bacterium]